MTPGPPRHIVLPSMKPIPWTIAVLPLAALPLRAAVLNGSDTVAPDFFGAAAHVSGTAALAGAPNHSTAGMAGRGAAYQFRSVSTLAGTVTQNAKLFASDGAASDQFGASVCADGASLALIGAPNHRTANVSDRGAAYLFRSLTSATGSVGHTVKLISTGGTAGDKFGSAVALQANLGLVGAPGVDFFGISERGTVYLFDSLNTASGTVNETSILYDTGGGLNSNLGASLALWLDTAVAGSPGDDVLTNDAQGSACYYRDLYNAGALVGQAVKLTASDGAAADHFGSAAGLSGDAVTGLRYAVIGAPGDNFGINSDQGSAYLYRITTTATGTLTQHAKLTASTGTALDQFGSSISVSGPLALVGALAVEGPGYACLYPNLNTTTGTVNESIRLTANDGFRNDEFGRSVALDGDIILIGASAGNGAATNSGKSYTASYASLTTLDATSASRTIEHLNFRSRTNWTIGDTHDGMTLTLAAGCEAELVLAGTTIHVGRTGTADNNRLIIEGNLGAAPAINVGTGTNTGNELRINNLCSSTATSIRAGSILSGDGQHNGPLALTGSLRPGEGTSRATFDVVGHVTWHAGDAWQFDLAAANASDRLNIIGTGAATNYDFLKGTGSAPRIFDFLGSAIPGTYTLVTWDGNTTFTASDFAATNVGGLNATFAIAGKSLTVTLGSLTALEQWRQTHFGNSVNTGNGADTFDFDKDGQPNLVEYALGTNPTLASSRVQPTVSQSGGRLTLTFTPQVVTGLTFAVQTSANLGTWTATNLTGLTAGTARTWTDTALMSAAARRWVRLRVSY